MATDPNGPAPFESPAAVVNERFIPATFTYGATRSVCSSFIRLSLQAGGFTELDRNKTFPRPSAVGPGVPDGLFFYDAAERRTSADVLYAFLQNKVDGELSNITATTEKFWSAGLGTIPVFGYGTVFVSGDLARSGTLVSWATDAPDDVANQVVSCFASDFCAEDAKDSSRWEDPGTGIAVAPDDLLNHYESPRTGGPYGYDEQMVFRGKDGRSVYEWRPAAGSAALTVAVVLPDAAPVPAASAREKRASSPLHRQTARYARRGDRRVRRVHARAGPCSACPWHGRLVAPDGLLNRYDSPLTGEPYGSMSA